VVLFASAVQSSSRNLSLVWLHETFLRGSVIVFSSLCPILILSISGHTVLGPEPLHKVRKYACEYIKLRQYSTVDKKRAGNLFRLFSLSGYLAHVRLNR
jgi:hypothetical protein